MAKLKIGVIGAGRLVREVHGPNLQRLAAQGRLEWVAIADPAFAQPDLSSPPGPRRFIDWREMLTLALDAHLDAVLVASPTFAHAEQAEAILRAGLGLYLEKPLAADYPSAQAVAALDHGRTTMGFNYREHPLHQRALEELRGRVRHMKSQFSIAARPLPPWRRQRSLGGGVLLDLAVHHLDLALRLFARPPLWVECQLRSHSTEGDEAHLRLGFAGDALYEGYFAYHGGEVDRMTLNGKHHINRYQPLAFPLFPPNAWWRYQSERWLAPWKEASFARALENWVDALATQRPTRRPMAAPLADGLLVQQVVHQAELAALTRTRVGF